jgi:hypothetical protein
MNENTFTTDKNLVIAVNELTRNIRMFNGTQHSSNYEAGVTEQLASGHGVLVSAIVTAVGTTPGNVYDTVRSAPAPPGTLIASIPNTLGRFEIGCPYFEGLYVEVGSGQQFTLVYS